MTRRGKIVSCFPRAHISNCLFSALFCGQIPGDVMRWGDSATILLDLIPVAILMKYIFTVESGMCRMLPVHPQLIQLRLMGSQA